MYVFMLCMFIGFMGFFSFILNYNHLLNSLLSLELISVSVYFLLGVSFVFYWGDLFYLMYFLVMVVCESVLGLSLLIFVTYGFGEDYFKSINILTC
uniref:NADH-ubiquinone oxidoreductase chain 4L n=1 Tax=Trinorchestia longiramus TaxID=1923959 RepID=A0A385UNX6_9CRUS|nr:NADH dehydrogenase subunit 4L [Trinorchestia longiramus]AYB71597.1 NADH dehydrogenase subunit 4L [Trinorchestia longiramus]